MVIAWRHDMPDVRIWAPRARQLEGVVGERRIPAQREADGWWRLTIGETDDYLVSVDSGPGRPDPRSRWQPSGVDGATRWLEPARLSATERFAQAELRDAVIYELHVGTFTQGGTFASAIERLEHLVELGVTHVEIMPVAQFPGRHGWGYDGVDLYAAHEPYGGPAGLRELIRACHQRGLAVIVDVVLNHFGPEGSYIRELGPYLTDRYRTPWGDAVNLDGEGSREVRRFLIGCALSWLRDYDADGLRLDAVHALHDRSERHFVAELVDEVRALERERRRRFVLIGEYDEHDPTAVRVRADGGWGLDAHWNDDFHHALHVLLAREQHGYYVDFPAPGSLPKVLERGYALDGVYSAHRAGVHGMAYGDLPRDRLVAYTQSHDQVGNRGQGERLVHLCGHQRAAIAAALLFASPFVPMLFQGEEWAASTPFYYFCDLQSPELRRAVEEGRRREHGGDHFVDPLAPETRDASVLRWDELAASPHREMLDWYRSLIALRRRETALRDPAPDATRVRRDGALLLVERAELVLACNLGDHACHVDVGDVVAASEALASHQELPALACAIGRRR